MNIGVQYDLTTGAINATISPPLTDTSVLPSNVGQIILDDSISLLGMMFDITQNPPVLVLIPAS